MDFVAKLVGTSVGIVGVGKAVGKVVVAVIELGLGIKL